jgi:predicted nucleic acid-binding protein
MLYVDTSALVALHTREARSTDVSRWYAACTDDLVSAAWCVSEFASALSIKQRTGQIGEADAQAAWRQFERMCAGDLYLLPVEPATFHRAAILSLDVASGLRAGDALHLAAALEAKAKGMATLDEVMATNAKRLKFKLVSF